MNDYPTTTPDGRTVWACCVSTIGPVCGHMSAPVTDGWVTYDPGTSVSVMSPDAPDAWADGYRDSRFHHHRGRCFVHDAIDDAGDPHDDDDDAQRRDDDYADGYRTGCRAERCADADA